MLAGILSAGCAAHSVGALGPNSIRRADNGTGPLYKVVYDGRFAEARAYAAEAERGGLTVTALEGDPTALWLYDLGPHWAAGGGAVAGVTTARTLLCLEQMAHDVWRRVRARDAYGELVCWTIDC